MLTHTNNYFDGFRKNEIRESVNTDNACYKIKFYTTKYSETRQLFTIIAIDLDTKAIQHLSSLILIRFCYNLYD